MNYVVWCWSHDPKACELSPLENVPDSFELFYGVSRAKSFSPRALFRMDPDFLKAIRLNDSVRNEEKLIVASKRLKNFLEAENVPDTEYLRVKILNHKGKVASPDSFIVHQVGTQDCIDLKKSVIEWNSINPQQIDSVEKLVIDEKKIARDATLFRPKSLPTAILVRRDLADKLGNAGFTGIAFQEVAQYREI
jgi:hypothetical protein